MTPARQLRAVRRYRWAVLALTLLGGVGAALLCVVQTPVYRASVQLLFSPNYPTQDISELNAGGNYILQRVRSYAEIADSQQVATEVVRRLGLPYPPQTLMANTTVTTKAGTAVLEIAVRDPEPERARDIANAIADEFPGYIGRLEQTKAGWSPVKVTVVRRAVTPSTPDSPRYGTSIGLGLAGGFTIGVAAAMLRYARERVVRDAEHAVDVAGVPLLGAADAWPRVRANLWLAAAARPVARITLAGAAAGESAAGPAADLAVTFAEAGESVLLVDADLANPGVDGYLGLPPGPGLAGVLRRQVPLRDATTLWRADLPLYLLPAGSAGPEPGLLHAVDLGKEIEPSRLGCVLTICAGPPLATGADAMLVVDGTDATVLVVRAAATPVDELRTAVDVLRRMGANLLGLVVVPPRAHGRGRIT